MMKKVTARIKVVSEQSAYPGSPDATTKKQLKDLFDYVGSHYPEPEGLVIRGPHGGIAIVAQNPKFAKLLLETTHCIIENNAWGGEYVGLRELAVQVVNLYYKCDLSFQAHLTVAKDSGITLEQQAAIPYWRTIGHMFDDEQRLVIEYTNAVLVGDVSNELFGRVAKRFGEKGAMECAAAIGLWACWAMILNATGTQSDFGYGPRKK
jgi:alkylhydroperoxidase family enzyme